MSEPELTEMHLAKPTAPKQTPIDLINKMLESEIGKGLAEAKDFEKFVRTALVDIMRHVLEIEKRLPPK